MFFEKEKFTGENPLTQFSFQPYALTDTPIAYALAVILSLFAMSATQWTRPLAEQHSMGLFMLGVIITAWFGGYRAGLLATLVSAILWTCFIAPPVHSMWITNSADRFRLVMFVFVCVLLNTVQLARWRTSRALETNQLRFNTVIEATGMGMWDYDCVDGTFWWSDGLKKMLNVKEGEFSPTFSGFLMYVDPACRQTFIESAGARAEVGLHFQFSLNLNPKNAPSLTVMIRGKAFLDRHGHAERIMGIMIPITEEALLPIRSITSYVA